jgi:hypothetical protein
MIPAHATRYGDTMRLLTLLLLTLPLAGCADREAKWATQGRTSLIGLDQSTIRMCAGLPSGTVKDGRTEIWMYERNTSSPAGVAPVAVTLPLGLSVGGATPVGYCRVQMRFAGGKVSEVHYAGATDIASHRDAACGQIVRSCLPREGRPID